MPRTPVLLTQGTTAVTTSLVLALLLTGCGAGPSPARELAVTGHVPSATASQPAAVPSPGQAPVEPSAPSAGPTGPTATSSPPPRTSVDLAAVQRRLAELRYYGAAVDGLDGPALHSAVQALQKVNGLRPDGAVGPRTLAALASPRPPVLRRSGPPDRVEVDLDRQVLHVVEDGQVVRTMPVSSGNGETYLQKDGSRARALTPVGTYTIERRIVGVREADLGTLYDPQYFHRGWAVHGSDSVPSVPASHGCVRVSRADAKYLLGVIGIGTTVHLHGGRHVFSAGSRAAGTSAPTGDTAAVAASTTS